MSIPPPSAPARAAGAVPTPRELVVPLARHGGRRRRVEEGDPTIRFGSTAVVIQHPVALIEPLRLPYGAFALAAVDEEGLADRRLPVLRRLASHAVIPRREGVEGWLWTSRAGGGVPSLDGSDRPPNAVLLLAKPISGAQAALRFAPDWVRALGARSPLRDPIVVGLLVEVADPRSARTVFERVGLDRPITDREIPPALRRSLPDDRPADIVLGRTAAAEAARAATSVAPPGRP